MTKKSEHLIALDQKEIVLNLPIISIDQHNLEQVRKLILEKAKQQISSQTSYEEIQVNTEVKLFLFRPDATQNDTKLPVIYYIHGGGFISGSALMYENKYKNYAKDFNCIVAAVEYRLAPEHPFPTPLLDCVAGIKWLNEHADALNLNRERFTIMGESAGGGLTAALHLYLRDKTNIRPKNQILIYPMLDFKTSKEPDTYPNSYVGEFLWIHGSNEFGWEAMLGGNDINNIDLAYYSPSYAKDHHQLAKTYIAVGSLDLFLEENIDYAIKLSRAGTSITLNVVAGGVHGFNAFPGKTANDFNHDLSRYIKDVI